MTFVIKVREVDFWNQRNVKEALQNCLTFMTGDKSYVFHFQGGHSTNPVDLFDREVFHVSRDKPTSVALFSGGLDSLVGCIELLNKTTDDICLVSHRSGNPVVKKTQETLVAALLTSFPERIKYYKFNSGLLRERAVHESQRTRSFLFSAIGMAIAHAYQKEAFYLFDNGITSINLPRREDLISARASRTTHPQTISQMQILFSLVKCDKISIINPFLWKTKTDVLGLLHGFSMDYLLTSAVSCGRTFKSAPNATHCGCCYQCIDRRLAIFANGLQGSDNPLLYGQDVVSNPIHQGESKTILLDYLAQASHLANCGLEQFYSENLKEITEIVECIEGNDNEDKVEKLWNIFRRHGNQIICSLNKIRNLYDDPSKPMTKGSLLEILSKREYLKEPVFRLVEEISKKLRGAIPVIFQRNKPKDENDFNDKVQGIIMDGKPEYEREYPVIKFGIAKTTPDHSIGEMDLLIESKFIRGKVKPSKITDEIASDIIKYPERSHILFVVYDPFRSIVEDGKFKDLFEGKRSCTILIAR